MTTAKMVRSLVGPEDVERLRVYADKIAAALERTCCGIIFYEPDANNPRPDAAYMRFYIPEAKKKKDHYDQLCLVIYQWMGQYLLADPSQETSLWPAENGRVYQIIGGAPQLTPRAEVKI